MRMMSPLTVEGKPLDVAARLAELTGFVSDAARDGLPAHELERGVWQYLLRLGHDRHSAPPYSEFAYRATKCAPSKANKVS